MKQFIVSRLKQLSTETLKTFQLSIVRQETVDNVSQTLVMVFEQEKPIYALLYSLLDTAFYIEKVDSFQCPPGVASLVTLGILDYMSSFDATIHVFARASDQYLFHNSKDEKNVRSDRQLVDWWQKVLSKVSGDCYFYVPGETRSRPDWTYGLIWKDTDPISVVPKFPDDPKTKVFSYLEATNTVHDLKTMLETTGECASITALFAIKCKGKPLEQSNGIPKDEMNKLMTELLKIDFSKDPRVFPLFEPYGIDSVTVDVKATSKPIHKLPASPKAFDIGHLIKKKKIR